MNKNLYSLMLMDEVVAEIDKLAVRRNTSRSALVNQILADYVSLTTPEKRIDTVFRAVEALLSNDAELVPLVSPRQGTMSVKTSLAYKYRPTVKYEVQLYRTPQGGAVGELSVVFRTQSQVLLDRIADFFVLWRRLEDAYLARFYPSGIRYGLYDGKFVRSIAVPQGCEYTSQQFGEAICAYVRMFDALLKAFVDGGSPAELERRYRDYLDQGIGLI